MAIVTQNPDEIKTSETVSSFMRKFGIAKLLARCGAYKEKGVSVFEVFLAIFQSVFADRSIYKQFKTGKWTHGFSQNTVYRLRNNAKIHWERFTSLLSAAVANALRPLTSEKRKETFIIDDTLHERAGYKRTELCAKVYDHSEGRYCKGFRLLTLGWSDGNTFLPITHRLLSSANEKNVLGTVEKRDCRTIAGRRRKQAREKGTEVMVSLLKSALKAGHRADYVLFDTWFSNPKQIADVKGLKMDVVAMVKKTGKIHYRYNGEMLDIRQIYARNKKRRGKSRYLLSVDVTVVSGKQEIPAKIVCVRNRSNRKDWLAILSTDSALDETEIIRLYGRRWDIEVFFKTCKSVLKLASECHSLSYDALTSHVSIVFARYIFLAYLNRMETDERSFGDLFYAVVDELADITFDHALSLIVSALIDSVREIFHATDEQITALMNDMLSRLPVHLRNCLCAA